MHWVLLLDRGRRACRYEGCSIRHPYRSDLDPAKAFSTIAKLTSRKDTIGALSGSPPPGAATARELAIT